jgi:hypothetical protein
MEFGFYTISKALQLNPQILAEKESFKCTPIPNRAKINLLGAKYAQFYGVLHMPLPKFGAKFSGGCICYLESKPDVQIQFDRRF